MVRPEEGKPSESGKADAGSREFAGSSPGMIGSMDSFAFVQHAFRRSAIRASRPSQDSDMPGEDLPRHTPGHIRHPRTIETVTCRQILPILGRVCSAKA